MKEQKTYPIGSVVKNAVSGNIAVIEAITEKHYKVRRCDNRQLARWSFINTDLMPDNFTAWFCDMDGKGQETSGTRAEITEKLAKINPEPFRTSLVVSIPDFPFVAFSMSEGFNPRFFTDAEFTRIMSEPVKTPEPSGNSPCSRSGNCRHQDKCRNHLHHSMFPRIPNTFPDAVRKKPEPQNRQKRERDIPVIAEPVPCMESGREFWPDSDRYAWCAELRFLRANEGWLEERLKRFDIDVCFHRGVGRGRFLAFCPAESPVSVTDVIRRPGIRELVIECQVRRLQMKMFENAA